MEYKNIGKMYHTPFCDYGIVFDLSKMYDLMNSGYAYEIDEFIDSILKTYRKEKNCKFKLDPDNKCLYFYKEK